MARDQQEKLMLKQWLVDSEQSFAVLQKQSEVEFNKLRQLYNDKTGVDSVSIVKQNEKSSALFTEVVRIGEEQERVI